MKKRTIVEFQNPSHLNREQDAVVDVLARMLSRPSTRALLAEPGLKVVQGVDPATGRQTLSFRSPDDPSYDEGATGSK